jgi:hypothetical protein
MLQELFVKSIKSFVESNEIYGVLVCARSIQSGGNNMFLAKKS